MKTKIEIIEKIAELNTDCGFTNYYGFKMSIEDFKSQLSKKKKWELYEQLYNDSEDGQFFLTN